MTNIDVISQAVQEDLNQSYLQTPDSLTLRFLLTCSSTIRMEEAPGRLVVGTDRTPKSRELTIGRLGRWPRDVGVASA